jgi:hypothetical protein
MRQHTSAYVSIRQHTSEYVSKVSIEAQQLRHMKLMLERCISVFAVLHTSAYVSIRQHTSAASAYEAHARTSYQCILTIITRSCLCLPSNPHKYFRADTLISLHANRYTAVFQLNHTLPLAYCRPGALTRNYCVCVCVCVY